MNKLIDLYIVKCIDGPSKGLYFANKHDRNYGAVLGEINQATFYKKVGPAQMVATRLNNRSKNNNQFDIKVVTVYENI